MDGAGPSPRVVPLTGAALRAALDDLADLRIAVFRDWPYLYEGDRAYERDYLATYAESDRALVVGAYAPGGRLIGAATAAPMADHAAEFAEPFRARGLDISALYYLGESVLLPEWRGRGIGHAFFDHREAAARGHGFAVACFCAVVRPEEHAMRPPGYRPLDPFWRRRGYVPAEGLVTGFEWADRGEGGAEIDHPMQFWTRRL
ncbi:MAG: GNAT family N-acetyltransferase [Sphingobium sp.]